LCSFWLEWELRIVRPKLIVTAGGLAARRLVGIARLDDCIGSSFERTGAVVIPLPHPSGVSRWLNQPANRARLDRALALVRARLRALDRE
jgi:uracil-DNA glycosylase